MTSSCAEHKAIPAVNRLQYRPSTAISNTRSIISFMLLLSVLIGTGSTLFAQVTSMSGTVNGETNTPVPGAGHDYIHLLAETVDPSSGSVSVRINIPTPNSRGLTLPLSIGYSTAGLFGLSSKDTSGPALFQLPYYGPWQYSYPQSHFTQTSVPKYGANGQYEGTNNTWTSFTFADPSGITHNLRIAYSCTSGAGQTCPDTGNVAGDGDVNAQFTSIANNQPFAYTVNDKTGTTFTFSTTTSTSAYWYFAQKIEDRNGNTILPTRTVSNGQVTLAFPDTAGRTGFSISGTGPAGASETVVAAGLTYEVNWTTATVSYSVPAYSYFTGTAGCNAQGAFSASVSSTPASNSTVYEVASIGLPNGQQYTFYYGNNPDPSLNNPYGLLSEIIYPNGGWVKYTYRMSDTYAFGGLFNGWLWNANGTGLYPASNLCPYVYSAPVLASRTVSYDGVNTAETQTFSNYSTTFSSTYPNISWTSKTVSVNTTVGSQTYLTTYSYSPVAISPPYFTQDTIATQIPVESQVKTYNWGNTSTPLLTVTKSWLDQFHMSEQDTTLSTGATSKKTYTYTGVSLYGGYTSQQILAPRELDEYDFGSSTATRKTISTYQTFDSPGIIIAPCKTVVTDGSGNTLSETDDYYDGGTSLCGTDSTGIATASVSGLPTSVNTHDESVYGPSASTPRGNVTKEVRVLSGGSGPTTTYTYDETGQALSKTDPCGNTACSDMTGSNHTTTYTYTDSPVGGNPAGNSNAYLTQISYATPADGVAQKMTFSYNYATGELAGSTDENGQPTSYTYSDPLNRLTQTNYPDGGQTEVAYNDSVPSVTSCQLINGTAGATCSATSPATGWKTTLSTSDGMGHVTQTQLVSDPSGTDIVDTSYDGEGRVLTRSNPHRVASGTTDGVTTYSYDSLGRTIKVSEPDGSIVTTTYDQTNPNSTGTCTTVTDEAGKSRQSCADALGRTTGVWEDPGSSPHLSYETDYTYDALGDLTYMNQKGSSPTNARTRTFQYDSLSRLTTAANPESGTIQYTYDANSNLSTKVAPSPNVTVPGYSVTTNYTYDTLNRLTQKGYADTYTSNPATPTATYAYDGGNISTCPTAIGFQGGSGTNSIGRRTAMCFGGGSKSWTFDPMGRIATENDRFTYLVPPYSADVGTIGGVSTLSQVTSYAYYLNGDLFEVFYPGPKGPPDYQFHTGENAAGQVTGAGDIYFQVLQNVTYTPTGQLATGLVGPSGSYDGSTISNTYNNRLQPVSMTASTYTGTPILNLTYNFNLGNGTSGTDNGNVIQIVNGKNNNRTQNFVYDPLNRIWQAYTTGSNWGETYSPTTYAPGTAFSSSNAGIDAWGNLTNRSGVTGKTGSENALNCAPASVKNQLTTCLGSNAYDLAGNLENNGGVTYTYDAENRLIATGSTSYIYDGDGNRIEKCTTGTGPGTCSTTATGTIYWLHAGGGTLAESNLGGNWTAAYGLVRGQIVSRVDLPSTVVHYYYHDHLNSTSIVTDAVGNIQNESDYYPYGGEMVITGSDSNRYKFTGKERDNESGLDNFGKRYFGSSLGRFVTPDPDDDSGIEKDPQSWNRYAYARNNPLRFTDPNGENYHVCDENGQNCSDQSDKDFDQTKKNAQQSGEVWQNGKIYAPDENGTLQFKGTYTQTDVDLPGDPEANRQAAAFIVNTFDSAMKEFGKNALYAATGTVVFRGIGTAIESIRAVQAVENIPMTTHAALRMAERGITQQAVDYAVESAERVGNVVTQTGKYGTTQEVFTGTNGITAVVETEGRNAGKVVTTYWTGSKP